MFPKDGVGLTTFYISTLVFILLGQARAQQTTSFANIDCCPVKKVEGSDSLSGSYYLVDVDDALPNSCKDACVYRKDDDDERRFCFIGSQTHQTECVAEDLATNPAEEEGFSTTEEPSLLPTVGTFSSESVEFKQIYLNITADISPLPRHPCDLQAVLEDTARNRPRTFTILNSNKMWQNAKVRWNFVSDHHNKFSVMKDENIGLNPEDLSTTLRAMKQIEENTCIKFVMDKNVEANDEDWLLIFRESKASDRSCQKEHINNLVKQSDKYKTWFQRAEGTTCFGGAYAFYGASKPQNMVIGRTRLDEENQGSIGLIAHELLHNLGFGHTQKREDAEDFIDIRWENIRTDCRRQYEPCSKDSKGKVCPNYKTYGIAYDCESIMHYEDWQCLTPDASNKGLKSMYAKNPSTCDITKPKIRLSKLDVEIMNRMYCQNTIRQFEVASPNHPRTYPNNIGVESSQHEQKISVTSGSLVGLTFTDFNVEGPKDDKCQYDWLQIVDGDGTELTEKICGFELPAKPIISKTNVMIVKFFSDATRGYDGFRAQWKKVKTNNPPVDGNWGSWGAWSSCSNNQDGKSTCKKTKSRHCNNPPASNGGANCTGDRKVEEDCTSADLSTPADNPRCMIQGAWSTWSEYSRCNSDCLKTKTRSCNSPAPINDQDKCSGEESETGQCSGGDCASATSGTVKSPNYPLNYSVDQDITFPLMVAEGKAIELTFTSMEIEECHDPMWGHCFCDYVEVLDSDESRLLKECNNEVP